MSTKSKKTPTATDATPIVWTDVRIDKTDVSVCHERAELNGFEARIFSAGAMPHWEAEVDGETTKHRDYDLARKAAEKRLRAVAARPPADRISVRLSFSFEPETPVMHVPKEFLGTPEQEERLAAFWDAVAVAAHNHLGAKRIVATSRDQFFSLVRDA